MNKDVASVLAVVESEKNAQIEKETQSWKSLIESERAACAERQEGFLASILEAVEEEKKAHIDRQQELAVALDGLDREKSENIERQQEFWQHMSGKVENAFAQLEQEKTDAVEKVRQAATIMHKTVVDRLNGEMTVLRENESRLNGEIKTARESSGLLKTKLDKQDKVIDARNAEVADLTASVRRCRARCSSPALPTSRS